MKNLSLPAMKINSRDKQLVTLLGLVVLAFLCYYFIISPAWDKNVANRSQADTLKIELESVKTTITNLNKLKIEDRQTRVLLVEKYKTFFNELRGDRLLYYIDTLMATSGFQVDAYSPSDKVVTQIQVPVRTYIPLAYPISDLAKVINVKSFNNNLNNSTSIPSDVATNIPADQTETAVDQIPADTVAAMDLNLTFSSADYQKFISFVKSLEDMNKAIIVKSVNITKSNTGLGIDGEIIVSLYSMPKLDDSENDYLMFLPQIPRGKTNPFI